jgi:RES domain-containing protein
MTAYRISNQIYGQDLSGKGAALYGGRWNSKGNQALYLSSSVSLALLEILVNSTYEQLQHTAFEVISLEIKAERSITFPKDLDKNWKYLMKHTRQIGDEFLNLNDKLMLKIPSAVIETEYNFMLNPDHIEFKKIKIIDTRPLSLDNRLIKLV